MEKFKKGVPLTREQMKGLLKRIPDRKDKRDFRLSIPVPEVLPKNSSVFKYLNHIEDQGNIGSCTAESGTTVVEAELRYHKKVSDIDLSALFLYWCEREILGTTGEDSGAEMRNICDAGKKYGFCLDATWPYKESALFRKPPQRCFDEAVKIRVSRYERLMSQQEIMATIAKGRNAVLIGYPVYTSFFDIGADGIMPMPKRGEYIEGGHAVAAYRYTPDGMWIRNSWGPNWGKAGDFFMPWTFYNKYRADIDVWRIISVVMK